MTAGLSILLIFGTPLVVGTVLFFEDPSMPWDKIAGGSAALALLASFVVFLRHMADIKKEHHETIRKAHETICVQAGKHTEALERFATALETCASTFAATTLSIQKEAHSAQALLLSEARAEHAKCEETIHSLLRGRRQHLERRDEPEPKDSP
jgi:hypothetical protein